MRDPARIPVVLEALREAWNGMHWVEIGKGYSVWMGGAA